MDLIKALEAYEAYDKNEERMVRDTIDYLKNNEIYLGKENLKGHITGSSWIVNKKRDACLLTHHGKLDIWVQLGGHTEVDESVFESAYREGIEESGFEKLNPLSQDIFDVDVHLIPEKKAIPRHFHYDIRYLFEADDDEKIIVSDESHDIQWVKIKEIDQYSNDESIQRMVRKMEGLWQKD
jgi:8-oxo-dGTP pyrophosphatase MutT (NUDIX family)